MGHPRTFCLERLMIFKFFCRLGCFLRGSGQGSEMRKREKGKAHNYGACATLYEMILTGFFVDFWVEGFGGRRGEGERSSSRQFRLGMIGQQSDYFHTLSPANLE